MTAPERSERSGMVLVALGSLLALVVVLLFLATQRGGHATEFRVYGDPEVQAEGNALVEITRWRRDTGAAVAGGRVELAVTSEGASVYEDTVAMFSPLVVALGAPLELHVTPPEGESLSFEALISEQEGRTSDWVERRPSGVEVISGSGACADLRLEARVLDGAMTANVAEILLLRLSDDSGAPVAGQPLELSGMGLRLSAERVVTDADGLASLRVQALERGTLRVSAPCAAGEEPFLIELAPYFDGLGFATLSGERAGYPLVSRRDDDALNIHFRLQDATMQASPTAEVVCGGDIVVSEVLSAHRERAQELHIPLPDRAADCWLQVYHRPHARDSQRVSAPIWSSCGSPDDGLALAQQWCLAREGEAFLPRQLLAGDAAVRDAAFSAWKLKRRTWVHAGFTLSSLMALVGVILVAFARRRGVGAGRGFVAGVDDEGIEEASAAAFRPANGALIVLIAGSAAVGLLFGGMYMTMRLMGL